MHASHVFTHREPPNGQATDGPDLLHRHICRKLVFAAGWDSLGTRPSRRCVDHAVARYRDVYAGSRRSPRLLARTYCGANLTWLRASSTHHDVTNLAPKLVPACILSCSAESHGT